MIDPIGSAISGLARPFFGLIDELFTSDDERAAAKLKLLEMDLRPVLAQIEVNRAEAGNPNWFVAGWRPFIGWVCGVIFAYAFIVRDLIITGAALAGVDLPASLPVVDIAAIMPVLLGMLGLGAMRSFEKGRGVEGNR